MLISFDYAALVYTREHYSIPIGWVLPEWSDDNQSLANALHPEYLFCSRKRLPPESKTLWQGPWQWAVYTVNDAREASAWLQRGMHLIETDVIRQLMSALEAEHSEGG
jgi:glycerophosphoryl diester phosphodiesterase